MTLWLVGMMGSGKSSVGEKAAEIANARHIDLDAVIEEKVGTSILEFWFDRGESDFRAIEVELLEAVAGAEAIVSTGGGAILDAGSRALMKNSGKVIWLKAEPEVLAARAEGSELRPLLAAEGDVLESLRRILEKREGLYRDVADVVMETDGLEVDAVAAEVRRSRASGGADPAWCNPVRPGGCGSTQGRWPAGRDDWPPGS